MCVGVGVGVGVCHARWSSYRCHHMSIKFLEHVSFYAHVCCSTSPRSGNQVDGLPLHLHMICVPVGNFEF